MSRVLGFLAILSSIHPLVATNEYLCGESDGSIICEAGDDCIIRGISGNGCPSHEMICPSDYNCELICDGDSVCQRADLYLNNASSVSITCRGTSTCQWMDVYGKSQYLSIQCIGHRSCKWLNSNPPNPEGDGRGVLLTQVVCMDDIERGTSDESCRWANLYPSDSVRYEVSCLGVNACKYAEIFGGLNTDLNVECASVDACNDIYILGPTDGKVNVSTVNTGVNNARVMQGMRISGGSAAEIHVTCDPQSGSIDGSCEDMVINAQQSQALQVVFGNGSQADGTTIDCGTSNCAIDASNVREPGDVRGLEVSAPNGADIRCNEFDDGYSCEDWSVTCAIGSCDVTYDEASDTYGCQGNCPVAVNGVLQHPSLNPTPFPSSITSNPSQSPSALPTASDGNQCPTASDHYFGMW